MGKQPFDEYRLALDKALGRGDATEHTHRPALKKLIESLYPGTTATNEPKRADYGAVDMRVRDSERTVGFIETKDVEADLAKAAKSDQLKRYLRALPSLILTDYLTFWWYRDGKRVKQASLGVVARGGKLKAEPEGGAAVWALLDEFFKHEAEPPATAPELAKRLAGLAHDLRVRVANVLTREGKKEHLHEQMEAFKKTLIPDLDEERFADMYAQTLAYGLFAARVECPVGKTFTRAEAAELIPHTNPFLRRMFHEIAFELDERIAPEVDYIAEVLHAAKMGEIRKDFTHKTGREDPVVHFYETFLAAYDPKMRERRGVYYTPEPVVSYIVRSVDEILKKDFKKPFGLADDSVFILDPACGTGSFLHEVIKLIHRRLHEKGEAGAWSDYVRTKLLPRIFGFELLMAPYAVAHLKLAMLLKDLGYDFKGHERVEVYLTNTLDEAIERSEMVFGKWIIDEANAAAEIKREKQILVVLGNPPYSGISANRGRWIRMLMKGHAPDGDAAQSYYEVDGKPLGERKVWLQDDYVKFIRWGQWRIGRTGEGVLAFITNHGYLDNPTFRGMRQSLMKSFDRIYVVDLHGSTKKREKAPDGSKDENVFDIQQGVAVGLFVKGPTARKTTVARHAEKWGPRKSKCAWLKRSTVRNTKWKRLGPNTPFYFFCPRDQKRRREYESNWTVADAFPSNGVGIVTARDHLSVRYTAREIWQTVKEFAALREREARERFQLGKDVQSWKVGWAQQDVRSSGPDRKYVTPLLYRPFDVRHTYYTGRSGGFICRPVFKVMGHMLAGENLALGLTRSVEIGRGFEHVFCARQLIQHHTVSLKEVDYLFPLYLYPSISMSAQQSLLDDPSLWPPGRDGRIPNLSPKFVEDFASKIKLSFVADGKGDLKKTFGPEDCFDYIYAVLHSPTYRKRYAEFLKTDFPRIPLTSDRALFKKLVGFGGELVSLHLMESPVLDEKPGPAFNVKGSNEVEKVRYQPKEKRAYINRTQHFEGVPQDVWDFHVGGYQVMAKWLKDRAKAKRRLLTDDVRHYKRVAVALGETIRLMATTDKAIPRWPIR